MNFRVVWMTRATAALARAYLAAENAGRAAAITAAMAEVDRLISTDPMGAGESRGGTERVVIVTPVVVEYEVFEDERVVVVTTARYAPGRGA